MVTLKNRTGNIVANGLLVKISSSYNGYFEYAGVGDIPVGVTAEVCAPGAECTIITNGNAKVRVDKYVQADAPLRSIVATDWARKGTAVTVGSETEYTMIGRALESGKGLIKVLINISPVIASGGGGGGNVVAGGTAGQVYTKIDGTDYNAEWSAAGGGSGTVTGVLGGYGIKSDGSSTTPSISFDGTELDIDNPPGTSFSATAYMLFTAGVVSERILISAIDLNLFDNTQGWTSSAGTITSVSGSGAITSSGSAAITIGFDSSLLSNMAGTLFGADQLLVLDTSEGTTHRKLVSSILLGEFNNNDGWASGTVTGVLGGYGIKSDGSSTTPSISFDGTELDIDDNTAWNPPTTAPYVVFTAGVVTERILASLIPLSSWFDDEGWTSNAGTVTSLSGGTGITVINPSTTPTISIQVDELPEKSGALVGTDRLVGTTGTTNWAETISNIPLGIFNGSLGVSSGGTGLATIGVDYMLTGNGTSPLTAEANCQFDGSTLAITGAITATGEITAYASDRRLKTNIKRIPNPVEELLKLSGVIYEWIDGVEKLGFTPAHKSEVGMIAQQLREWRKDSIAPAPFDVDKKTGKSISGKNYITTKPEKVVPLLIEGFKEVILRLEKLETKT